MAGLPRAAAQQPVVTLGRFSGSLQVLNQTMGQLERALQGGVQRGQEPAFPSILLSSPDGATWRVQVTNAGTLDVSLVTRG